MDSLKLNGVIKTPIDGDLGNVYEYIKNNFGSIMLVAIGFFLVMAYTSINNINFEKSEKELDKKFIIEIIWLIHDLIINEISNQPFDYRHNWFIT